MSIVIPHIKAISVVGKKPTVGSEPLHIVGNDYQTYYVKNHRLNTPASDLINEVIGHYLLKAWQIPTPNIALVEMPEATLNQDWGVKHKKPYYKRLAFGSKEVEAAFDLTQMANIGGRVDYRKLYRPEHFARIGLFDMWVENEDRPPDLKNIMLCESEERYGFLAIDQAMILRTGAYDTLSDRSFWPTEGNYCLQSAYFQALKRFYKTLNKDWVKIEEENFYICINRSKQYLTQCAQNIPTDWGYTVEIENLISEFLFDEERNKTVFNEYLRIFK